MGEQTLYLTCHCQANIFRLHVSAHELIEGATVFTDAESIKRRALWNEVDQARLIRLRGSLAPGSATAFCRVCGTTLFRGSGSARAHNGAELTTINLRAVRCRDTGYFDAHTIRPQLVQEPQGSAAASGTTRSEDLPGAEEYILSQSYGDIHLGSCACQAIKVAWIGWPLEDEPAYDCGCAICLGNGIVWIDPGRKNTCFHPHEPSDPTMPRRDLVTEYTFGIGQNAHYLCKTCGVEVYEYNASKGNDGWALNVMLADDAADFLGDLFQLAPGALEGRERQKRFKKFIRHVAMRKQGGPYRVIAAEEGEDQ